MADFAGYCRAELADNSLGLTFPMHILYPTDAPAKAERVGPYRFDVALNAPVQAGLFPLVIVSHGSGGSPLVYRTLAHRLARSGYVVGLPEHPFNNRSNNAWEGTAQNLAAWPRHLRLAIDSFFEAPRFAGFVKPDAVALVGHSMGGYAALALAGGQPTAFPWESPDGQPQRIAAEPDGRVKALVLLAPATAWFGAEGALHGVRAPILLMVGEKDEITPYSYAQSVLSRVRDAAKIEHRVVENAGHFSFLSPFPAALTSPVFPPSQDPPGFDRPRFHLELNAAVAAFLAREL